MNRNDRTSRGGQTMVLFAAAVIVLAAICVLAIDIGIMFVSWAQLQNAVDAASLAGASQLTGFVTQAHKDAATAEALEFALANKVAGKNLRLNLSQGDVEFGRYNDLTREFIPESQFGPGDRVDSIRVTGRRTPSSLDGPVNLFFGPIFGLDYVSLSNVVAVGTQPHRYVVFVLDRSGSMCYDTSGVVTKSSPQANYSMVKSPTGWYWMPRRYYYSKTWQTAYFYAKDDATGQVVTSFLPPHIQARLVSGQYFRFCSYDQPDVVESGWLYAPPNVTIYSRYNTLNWSADAYGPVSACGYAYTTTPLEPIQDAKDAACSFVDLLSSSDDRAALVTFAWNATTDCTLTNDWTTLKNKIGEFTPNGATATPNGMDMANDELIDSGRATGYGHKVMILLSDGMANCLNSTNYGNATETYTFLGQSVTCQIRQTVAREMETQTLRAKGRGIRIYTVSFGADADTTLAPLIAQETNGAFYYAVDHDSLTEIFTDIFQRLPPILTR